MCDIFPEYKKCCFCCSLRTGCLIIAILGIMTGVAGLTGLYQHNNWKFEKVNKSDIKAVFHQQPLKWPKDFVKKSDVVVPVGVAIMSILFMVLGVVLYYSALFDSVQIVQLFVMGIFFNVVFGICCCLAVSVQCMQDEKCIFGADMDWLTGSIVIILIISYLLLWFYFISIANSYVNSVYD